MTEIEQGRRSPNFAPVIPHSLVEAYCGFYDLDNTKQAEAMIRANSRKDRLAVYLVWNGIIGWTDSIFQIATEDFT